MTPYLHFQGNCREAMTAYQAIFGGQLDMMDYAQLPAAAGGVPGSTRIMHSALMSPEVGDLQGSDFPPGQTGAPQASVSVSIQLDKAERTTEVYAALIVGGQASMPLAPTFFSPAFAMLRDRFGTHWILSTTPVAQ